MHEMWNVAYAKADLMFLGGERDFKKKKILKKKGKLIWKADTKKILENYNNNNKVMLQTVAIESRIQLHDSYQSEQADTMDHVQFEFKLSQVFPISRL